MEKIFINKRLVAIAFFTVFSTTMISKATANDNCGESGVELKLTNWIKGQPMFQLRFNGQSPNDEVRIIIRDEFNNTLYHQKIIGQRFEKSFLLNTTEILDDTLSFEIVSSGSHEAKIYRINRDTFRKEEIA